MWAIRVSTTAVLLVLSTSLSAAGSATLETRIQQLERKLDSRSLTKMHDQIAALQRVARQLRGEIEVQTHTLKNLQKRQRDLYLDIDRRLHRIEAGGTDKTSGLPTRPAVPAAAAATLNPADQRKAYDQALGLLKDGRYRDASAAFDAFLKAYPGSSYADNAQYWLGEVYYVTREFKLALSEFGKVLKQHPDSSKGADARLKMGYIYYEQKQWAKARDSLEQLVKLSPGTTSAKLAQARLDRMQQEGV